MCVCAFFHFRFFVTMHWINRAFAKIVEFRGTRCVVKMTVSFKRFPNFPTFAMKRGYKRRAHEMREAGQATQGIVAPAATSHRLRTTLTLAPHSSTASHLSLRRYTPPRCATSISRPSSSSTSPASSRWRPPKRAEGPLPGLGLLPGLRRLPRRRRPRRHRLPCPSPSCRPPPFRLLRRHPPLRRPCRQPSRQSHRPRLRPLRRRPLRPCRPRRRLRRLPLRPRPRRLRPCPHWIFPCPWPAMGPGPISSGTATTSPCATSATTTRARSRLPRARGGRAA